MHFGVPDGLDVQLKTGKAHRQSSSLPCSAGVYPAKGEDWWVAVAVAGDDDWGVLCRLMEQPELADDRTFPVGDSAAA